MTILLWLQAIGGVLFGLAFLMITFASLVKVMRQDASQEQLEDAARRQRAILVAKAKWFESHPPTMHLIEALGKEEETISTIKENWLQETDW